MKIQDRLDSLQPYIVGIRYIQGMQIVDAVFKEGWNVPDSDIIRKEAVDGQPNYFMFYTEKEDVTVDDLLDYVEGIININIEREMKYELLKKKVEELKKIFKDNSLSKLEMLRFTFNEPDVLPTLMNMDINLDEAESEAVKPEPSEPKTDVITEKPIREKTNGNVAKIKGQEVELPPKDEKIVVEEFNEPEITCKCGPNDVCPVCEEEKLGAY